MTTTGITKSRHGLSRRALLKATAGTAALLGALQTKFPAGVHVAEAAGPEVTKAILGYIALIDASPLVIAKEKGLFAKHGMMPSPNSSSISAFQAGPLIITSS